MSAAGFEPTPEDLVAVRTFAQFLREAGPERVAGRWSPEFTARWMPYLQGESDGPVEP